jgi:hypothetical protein
VTSDLPDDGRSGTGRWRLRPILLLGALAAVGIALRAWILGTPWGVLNSDEALTGLIAKHVLHGDIPIVVPGNAYIAPLEGYLYIPIALTLGYRILALKLLMWVMWAVASWCAYLAARGIGLRPPWLAGAIVWLAPGMLMILSTTVYVGYASGMACVSLAAWALARLLETVPEPDWRRSAVFGFMCGAGAYLHPVFLTVLIPLAVVPALRFFTRIRPWWLPAGGAAAVAISPLVVWNLRHDWASLHRMSSAFPGSTYADRLAAQFTGALPRALGMRDDAGSWLLGQIVGTVIVVTVAAVMVTGCLLLARRSGPARGSGIALLLAVFTVFPLLALLRDSQYTLDARYMIVIVPLLALTITAFVSGLPTAWTNPAAGVVIATLVGVLTVPLLLTAGTDLHDPNARFRELAHRTESAGFTQVLGSYWLIHSVEIASDGGLTTAATGKDSYVRFPDNQKEVESADPRRVAIMLEPDDDRSTYLPLPRADYRRIESSGAVLYFPKR